MKFVAVVLAAGKSSRMGRNKLLLPFHGHTVLDQLLDTLKTPLISELIVVTGNKPEEVEGIIEAHGARRIHNSRFEEGMTTSVQAGFGATGGADGVFLFLGDQVGVREELLQRMIKELDGDAALVSPKHNDRRGHPVLFSRRLVPEVLSLKSEETLKDLVVRHEAEHHYVPGDEWTILDLDTPEDYEKALRLWSQR